VIEADMAARHLSRKDNTLAGGIICLDEVDTNHKLLLLDVLRRYGPPPKFATAIEKIYHNNTCVLKIENEVAEIPQSVGVCQGDNMAPVLFLFLMTAFAQTLELEWRMEDSGHPDS